MALFTGQVRPFHYIDEGLDAITLNIPNYLGIIRANPGADATWQLPTMAHMVAGAPLIIINNSIFTITVNAAAGDTIGGGSNYVIAAGITQWFLTTLDNDWQITIGASIAPPPPPPVNIVQPAYVATVSDFASDPNYTLALYASPGTFTLTPTSLPATLDGVTLATGNRVLVKNQTATVQNGLFAVTAISPTVTLLRTSDALYCNISIGVNLGTVNQQAVYALTTLNPVLPGVSGLTWLRINIQSNYTGTTAGDGTIPPLPGNDNTVYGALCEIGGSNQTIVGQASGNALSGNNNTLVGPGMAFQLGTNNVLAGVGNTAPLAVSSTIIGNTNVVATGANSVNMVGSGNTITSASSLNVDVFGNDNTLDAQQIFILGDNHAITTSNGTTLAGIGHVVSTSPNSFVAGQSQTVAGSTHATIINNTAASYSGNTQLTLVGNGSTVGASNIKATIFGSGNSASGSTPTIIGANNTTTGVNMTLLGANSNVAGTNMTTVGVGNTVSSSDDALIFGSSNAVSASDHSAIMGGSNTITGSATTVAVGNALSITNTVGGVILVPNGTTTSNNNTNLILIGSSNTYSTATSNLLITGSTNSLTGDNILVYGQGNTILASTLVFGGSNTLSSLSLNIFGSSNAVDTSTAAFVYGSGNVASGSTNVGIVGNSNTAISSPAAFIVGGSISATSSSGAIIVSPTAITASSNTQLTLIGQSNVLTTAIANVTIYGASNTASAANTAVFGTGNKVQSAGNAAFGSGAVAAGAQSSSFGFQAFMASTTSGSANTGFGYGVGASVTSGASNSIFGASAGTGIIAGGSNTIVGQAAGNAIVGGSNNTVVGQGANVASSSTYVSAIGSGITNTTNNSVVLGGNGIPYVLANAAGVASSTSGQSGFYPNQPANTKNPAGTTYQLTTVDVAPNAVIVAQSVTAGNETWTMPTAAALLAVFAFTAAGTSFTFTIVNQSETAWITLAANTGVTFGLQSSSLVPCTSIVTLKVTCTNAVTPTYVVQQVQSAPNVQNANNNMLIGTLNALSSAAFNDCIVMGTSCQALSTTNYVFGFNSIAAGIQSMSFGYNVFPASIISGFSNIGFGYQVGLNTTSGNQNTGFGVNAIYYNTTGNNNSAFGCNALGTNVASTQSPAAYSSCAAFGQNAMLFHSTGDLNVACGTSCLRGTTPSIISPAQNSNANDTAIGNEAMNFCHLSNSNVASGAFALKFAGTTTNNCAYGFESMFCNTTFVTTNNIQNNAAFGHHSLMPNGATAVAATFQNNAVFGALAMSSCGPGVQNNASFGYQTMVASTTNGQSAFGYQALTASTTATACAAFGFQALAGVIGGINNTAVGTQSGQIIVGGGNNTLLGAFSTTSTAGANFRVAIGATITNSFDNSAIIGGNSIPYAVATSAGISTNTSSQSGFYFNQPANTKNPAGTPYTMTTTDVSPDSLIVAQSVTAGGETWTIPTAASLVAIFTPTAAGTAFTFTIRNQSQTAAITLAANTGCTFGLESSDIVLAGDVSTYKVTCTNPATPTYVFQLVSLTVGTPTIENFNVSTPNTVVNPTATTSITTYQITAASGTTTGTLANGSTNGFMKTISVDQAVTPFVLTITNYLNQYGGNNSTIGSYAITFTQPGTSYTFMWDATAGTWVNHAFSQPPYVSRYVITISLDPVTNSIVRAIGQDNVVVSTGTNVNTGSTTTATVLNAAAAYLNTNFSGGDIFIKGGTYFLIASTWNITQANITVRGEASTILCANTANGSVIQIHATDCMLFNLRFGFVAGFSATITQNAIVYGNQVGVFILTTSVRVTLRDCKFLQLQQAMEIFNGATDTCVDRCNFVTSYNGILLASNATTFILRTNITNCSFLTMQNYGIFVSNGVKDCVIANNVIDVAQSITTANAVIGFGITTMGDGSANAFTSIVRNISIIGNQIRNCYGAGVWVQMGSDHVSITGNTFDTCAATAVTNVQTANPNLAAVNCPQVTSTNLSIVANTFTAGYNPILLFGIGGHISGNVYQGNGGLNYLTRGNCISNLDASTYPKYQIVEEQTNFTSLVLSTAGQVVGQNTGNGTPLGYIAALAYQATLQQSCNVGATFNTFFNNGAIINNFTFVVGFTGSTLPNCVATLSLSNVNGQQLTTLFTTTFTAPQTVNILTDAPTTITVSTPVTVGPGYICLTISSPAAQLLDTKYTPVTINVGISNVIVSNLDEYAFVVNVTPYLSSQIFSIGDQGNGIGQFVMGANGSPFAQIRTYAFSGTLPSINANNQATIGPLTATGVATTDLLTIGSLIAVPAGLSIGDVFSPSTNNISFKVSNVTTSNYTAAGAYSVKVLGLT